jgi:hypothetical protein
MIMLLAVCVRCVSCLVSCVLQDRAVFVRTVHLLHSHHLPGVPGPHDAEDEGLQLFCLYDSKGRANARWPCTVAWCIYGAPPNTWQAWLA